MIMNGGETVIKTDYRPLYLQVIDKLRKDIEQYEEAAEGGNRMERKKDAKNTIKYDRRRESK